MSINYFLLQLCSHLAIAFNTVDMSTTAVPPALPPAAAAAAITAITVIDVGNLPTTVTEASQVDARRVITGLTPPVADGLVRQDFMNKLLQKTRFGPIHETTGKVILMTPEEWCQLVIKIIAEHHFGAVANVNPTDTRQQILRKIHTFFGNTFPSHVFQIENQQSAIAIRDKLILDLNAQVAALNQALVQQRQHNADLVLLLQQQHF